MNLSEKIISVMLLVSCLVLGAVLLWEAYVSIKTGHYALDESSEVSDVARK